MCGWLGSGSYIFGNIYVLRFLHHPDGKTTFPNIFVLYDLLFFVFKIITDGVYLGLVLELSLPASSYATMALRELMKTAPAATADATTTGDANELMKRKLEPDAEHAPPAVGVESCEGSNIKKIKQEPGVTSDEKL